MRYEIPPENWTTALADAVKASRDGDVIVCRSEDMVRLAKRAVSRMCPDRTITFEVSDDTAIGEPRP